MNRFTRALLVTASTLLLTSCDAAAVSWGPVDSSYQGQTRVRGYGTWANEGYKTAANRITFRDTAPNDGNTVYVRTQVRWWKYQSMQSNPGHTWVNGTSKSTPEISSSKYQEHRVAWPLDSNASRARGVPQVCAQMGWPVPDSCTTGGVPTFDY